MSVLKHNLSIKNSVVAAVSAKVVLDMILKMTTPITETVTTKVSDVKNYENLIKDCLNDTNKLENMLSIIVAKSKNNVIGGASIYKILMPYCKKMYITQIEENFDGDAFFPEIEKEPFR